MVVLARMKQNESGQSTNSKRINVAHVSDENDGYMSEIPEDEEEANVSHTSNASRSNTDDTNRYSDLARHSRMKEANDNVTEVQKMSERESQSIALLKFLLLVTILLIASIVTAGSFMVLKEEENDSYKSNYNKFANTIQNAVESHVDSMYTGLAETSVKITTKAVVSNQEFPFVTIPEFESIGQSLRRHSSLEVVSLVPLVSREKLESWEKYSVQHQHEWLEPSKKVALSAFNNSEGYILVQPKSYPNTDISPYVYNEIGRLVIDDDPVGPYGPLWHRSPPPSATRVINKHHMWDGDELGRAANAARFTGEAVFSALIEDKKSIARPVNTSLLDEVSLEVTDEELLDEAHDASHASLIRHGPNLNRSAHHHLHSEVVYPVFRNINDLSSEVVALLTCSLGWDWYLINLLPEGVRGIYLILKNTCGASYSFEVDGKSAVNLGTGDLHDRRYDSTEVVIPFYRLKANAAATAEFPGQCFYSFHLYASESFETKYKTRLPSALAIALALAFIFMAATVYAYDWFVRRRNEIVVDAAARSNAIVSSLFPGAFKNRLMEQEQEESPTFLQSTKTLLKRYIFEQDEAKDEDGMTFKTKPIADLFTETTILFSDIAGFTSWSSTREPVQVFALLESIYKAFDEIAFKRHVFKVETVGDSYVAATGVPEPRNDHAVVMAHFAHSCLCRFRELVQQLEVLLGPGTADLGIRFGIHSGPVTAGVLRGERSRFQLFGDTMNTASRMESTGCRNKIQLSEATASLLIAAGKSRWVQARDDKVVAKGKGEMQTFWLVMRDTSSNWTTSIADDASIGNSNVAATERDLKERVNRVVSWTVDLLIHHLQSIQAYREQHEHECRGTHSEEQADDAMVAAGNGWSRLTKKGRTVLDEVKEIVHLPDFEKSARNKKVRDSGEVEIDRILKEQLTDYVRAISSMYLANPFHNFEHAAHVTMAVSKFLSRIVAPDIDEAEFSKMRDEMKEEKAVDAVLHDYTYGITSDPLTQFACVFSALIHDVDHTGVPNAQLCKENEPLASHYRCKSVAEQNSIDLAWNLLLDEKYREVRKAIAQTRAEQVRFRQLVVNSVLATDIMDKDLKALRNKRWEKAFSTEASEKSREHSNKQDDSVKDGVDRKATIVIEHLIQASDVAHTMQHWHVYRKWNARLFAEMYQAFLQGRSEKDPSEFWYKGEIGFFDFYVIPLAKKLKDCGVFGVSSSECLDYAEKNKTEWVNCGEQIVTEMVEALTNRDRVE